MLFEFLQIGLFMAVLLLLVKPLGAFMARVYLGERTFLTPVLGPVERFIYRTAGGHITEEMDWKSYAVAMLVFNVAGILLLYIIQRIQFILPLNPQGLPAVPPDLAFNTAVSFVTNTNWQSYSGETTLSYFTQMIGMTVQNFLSAATGMAILVALIRGFTRHNASTIGNFWVDLTRSVLYILLPISLLLSLALVSQGVVQTFENYQTASLLQSVQAADNSTVSSQVIAVGPAASQIAIKQLATNGGGFFNVNSAHPFENPTPFSNFLEMLAILAIPAALCYTFGRMVGDTRQGWAILVAMTIIFIALLGVAMWAEESANPALAQAGRRPVADRPAAGRQHGRQGDAVGTGQLGAVGHGHYSRLQRLGQFHARFVYAAGRHGPHVAYAAWGGNLRWGRMRPLWHAGLRDHSRFHSRPDDRPDPGIPG